MESSGINVTTRRARLALGDEAVTIGRQGERQVTADELAAMIATIRDEIVARNGHRLPHTPVEPCAS